MCRELWCNRHYYSWQRNYCPHSRDKETEAQRAQPFPKDTWLRGVRPVFDPTSAGLPTPVSPTRAKQELPMVYSLPLPQQPPSRRWKTSMQGPWTYLFTSCSIHSLVNPQTPLPALVATINMSPHLCEMLGADNTEAWFVDGFQGVRCTRGCLF